MQKNQNLNSNAQGVAAYTKEQKLNELKHTFRNIEEAKEDLIKNIDDFFFIGGLDQPIDAITDLLVCFFTALDSYEVNDNNKPISNYKAYDEKYVSDLIFSSCALIKALTQIHSNKKRVSFLQKNAEILKLEADLAQN